MIDPMKPISGLITSDLSASINEIDTSGMSVAADYRGFFGANLLRLMKDLSASTLHINDAFQG